MLTFPTQKSQDTTGSRFMQEILVVSRFFVPSQIHNSGKQIDLSGKWNQLNLGSLWSLPDLAGEEWFATELTKSKFCKNMVLSEQNFNFSVLIAYPILNLNSWDRLRAINCWDNNMSSCFSSFRNFHFHFHTHPFVDSIFTGVFPFPSLYLSKLMQFSKFMKRLLKSHPKQYRMLSSRPTASYLPLPPPFPHTLPVSRNPLHPKGFSG